MSTKLKAGTASSGAVLDADTTGILEIQSGSTPTTAVTVDASQNVGIGTASPAQKLDIASGGKIYLRRADNGTGATIWDGGAGSGGLICNELNSEGFAWQLNGSEKMRIDSSGNLLVGTTSNPNTSRVRISSSNPTAGYCTDFVQALANAGTYYYTSFWAGSTQTGYISSNGTSTTYSTSSDYRLKENIAPMTGALARISQLKPVTYNWKVDGSVGEGFIAHELQAVVPDCVTGTKDAVDEEGKPVYQGIDTSFLVATLTAAIQELNAKVDAQAAEIQALKGVA